MTWNDVRKGDIIFFRPRAPSQSRGAWADMFPVCEPLVVIRIERSLGSEKLGFDVSLLDGENAEMINFFVRDEQNISLYARSPDDFVCSSGNDRV